MVSRSALTCPNCGRVVLSLGCLGNFFAWVGLLIVVGAGAVLVDLSRAC
ncbi:MAG: hypothetical protein LAP13_27095 [Acidobacteriia bacterium]|nr:hypothetical protein [Terriglobia bacterium]